jgi:carbamoyltransferase
MKIISIFSGHDASMTVLNNGKIENYFKEERYSKVKHDNRITNLTKILFDGYLEDADYLITSIDEHYVYEEKRNSIVKALNPDIKIRKVSQHHVYHAALSFYNSGFEKSLVFVVDSAGSYITDDVFECESVYVAEYPSRFKPLFKKYWSFNQKRLDITLAGTRRVWQPLEEKVNIGNIYNSAAIAIGQTVDDCGKAMGLSCYGKPIKNFGEFTKDNIINYFKDYPQLQKILDFNDDIDNDIVVTKENEKFFADYCAQVQKYCQDEVCELVEKYVKETGIKKVCFSGGYGMNIITNYDLVGKFPDVDFYFEPMCDDSGLSIGAAMIRYRRISRDRTIIPMKDNFFHGK